VIAFAKALKLTVTAEGIEKEEQVKQLRALGCDWGQGYYFARPLSSDELGELFQDTDSIFPIHLEPVTLVEQSVA
jgi:EAL domain-containing protein (putative c-di-GMP-specific phosphodiesterase class I)